MSTIKLMQGASLEDYKQLYDKFLEYFEPREWVSPEAWRQHKHKGDYFFCSLLDVALIANMIWIREFIGKPIIVNDWFKKGGRFQDRGIRDNLSSIVAKRTSRGIAYLSGHPLAKSLDFHVLGQSPKETRRIIKENEASLPYPCRLERKLRGIEINWVHLDTKVDPRIDRVYLFDI